MSALTVDQIVTLTEVLVVLLGIAITWAVFYGSDRAELPGTAPIPEPNRAEDVRLDTRGRTLK